LAAAETLLAAIMRLLHEGITPISDHRLLMGNVPRADREFQPAREARNNRNNDDLMLRSH
jgi:hypothetical protein